MFRKNTILVAAIIGSTLLFEISIAEACSQCVFALFDKFIPPIFYWCLLSILWFLAIAFTASGQKEKIAGFPSFIAAFLLVLVLVIIGGGFFGPISILPLFIPIITATLNAFFSSNKSTLSPHLRKNLKAIGVCGVIALASLGAYSVYLRNSRTAVAYILEWEGTSSALLAIRDLKIRGAEAVPDLRLLIKQGNSMTAEIAAEELAVLGEPEIKVP